MKRILKSILWVLLIVALLATAVAVFFTIVEYRPEWIERVESVSPGENLERPAAGTDITLLTWNTGYGALDSQSDFVMDGGKMSLGRSADAVASNMNVIKDTIASVSPDLIFLQEVDTGSRRSYRFNEIEFLAEAFPSWQAFHAPNFNAVFVPFPFPHMMGRIYSGLMTLSRFESISALRYQFPGEFSWPLRTANLKRCMLVLEIPTNEPGKMLCAVNMHLSAYDKDGFLRSQELEYLRQYAVSRYNEGNYVIIGGDWNSLFPGVGMDHFAGYTTREENLTWIQRIPDDFILPGWTWAYDPAVPSVRTLEKPYVAGENFTGIIDGFLLSPNVKLKSVRTSDMQFSVSDHQNVYCVVELEP